MARSARPAPSRRPRSRSGLGRSLLAVVLGALGCTAEVGLESRTRGLEVTFRTLELSGAMTLSGSAEVEGFDEAVLREAVCPSAPVGCESLEDSLATWAEQARDSHATLELQPGDLIFSVSVDTDADGATVETPSEDHDGHLGARFSLGGSLLRANAWSDLVRTRDNEYAFRGTFRGQLDPDGLSARLEGNAPCAGDEESPASVEVELTAHFFRRGSDEAEPEEPVADVARADRVAIHIDRFSTQGQWAVGDASVCTPFPVTLALTGEISGTALGAAAGEPARPPAGQDPPPVAPSVTALEPGVPVTAHFEGEQQDAWFSIDDLSSNDMVRIDVEPDAASSADLVVDMLGQIEPTAFSDHWGLPPGEDEASTFNGYGRASAGEAVHLNVLAPRAGSLYFRVYDLGNNAAATNLSVSADLDRAPLVADGTDGDADADTDLVPEEAPGEPAELPAEADQDFPDTAPDGSCDVDANTVRSDPALYLGQYLRTYLEGWAALEDEDGVGLHWDPCSPACQGDGSPQQETWRSVRNPAWGMQTQSQVCRDGHWQTFDPSPRSAEACDGSHTSPFNPACCHRNSPNPFCRGAEPSEDAARTEWPPAPVEVTPTENGPTLEGTLVAPGQADWYQVAVEPGTLTVSISGIDADVDIVLRRYDALPDAPPEGCSGAGDLTTDDGGDGGAESFEVEVEQAGSLYVEVCENGDDATGVYTIAFNAVETEGDAEPDAAEPEPTPVNPTREGVTEAGEVVAGRSSWYEVRLLRRDSLTVRVTNVDANLDPILRAHESTRPDPAPCVAEGNAQNRGGPGEDESLTYQAFEDTITLYIQVCDPNGNEGSFQVTMAKQHVGGGFQPDP